MSHNILDKIIEQKRQLIDRYKSHTSLNEIIKFAEHSEPTRGFSKNLATKSRLGPAIIAEIKKASPSKGVIREDFDPSMLAKSYQQGGATCLSVLTDREFFQGHDDHLRQVKIACQLPVLRKDFIIDPWQIYQSRAIGADAILLICAVLDDANLYDMLQLAKTINLDCLVEVHNEEEMTRAISLDAQLIGINNRNLKTFTTDIQTSSRLVKSVKHKSNALFISESGITSSEQIIDQHTRGIDGFLIGESLMRQTDPGKALRKMLG